MGTWTGVIVELSGKSDFATAARANQVEVASAASGRAAVVSCGGDLKAPISLAEALSKALETTCLAVCAQTSADAYVISAFRNGSRVRHLEYARDDGGWSVHGTPQPWEPSFFFDDVTPDEDGEAWPHMLDDELSPEEIARYEAARRAKDPSTVMDLLNPHSFSSIERIAEWWGVDFDHPIGQWKAPSAWSKLFGK